MSNSNVEIENESDVISPLQPSQPIKEINSINEHDLFIIHQNIQSIQGDNNLTKKELILDILTNQEPDCLMLTETWIKDPKELINWIRFDTNGKYTIIVDKDEPDFTNFRGKGTAIIIKRELEKYIQKKSRFPGRSVIIELKRKKIEITIGVIYLPSLNHENKKEHRKIASFIKKTIKHKKTDSNIIIGGDWNAAPDIFLDREYQGKSEPRFKNTAETPFLNNLLKYNRANKLYDPWRLSHPTTRSYTHESGISRSRIDYFLVNSTALKRTRETNIKELIPGMSLHHKAITINLELNLDTQNNMRAIINRSKINVDAISQQDRTKFNEELEKTIEINNINSILDLEMTRNNTVQRILKASHEFLPTIETTINPNTLNNRKRKSMAARYWGSIQRIRREYRANHGQISKENDSLIMFIEKKLEITEETADIMVRLTTIEKAINKRIKKIKKTKIMRLMRNREINFINEQKRQIQNITEKKIAWDGIDYLNDTVTGDIITDPNSIKTIVKNFFESLMSKPDREEITIPDEWKHIYTPLQTVDANIYINLNNEITITEFKNAVKELPNNKACGPSGLNYDIIKQINNEKTLIALTAIINAIKEMNYVPTQDRIANIITLPKILDWAGNITKLRPITLLETLKKLISKIMTKRLTNIIEENDILKGVNYGFRKNNSTTDILWIIRNVIDYSNLTGNKLYISSLDIQKAYDTVPYEGIILSLRRIKVPEETIRTIMTLIQQREIYVDTPFGSTDKFIPERGLPQGDIMAPILWSIFYDPLMCMIQEKTKGVRIGDTKITAVAFADDIYPMSRNISDKNRQLSIIDSFLRFNKMTANASKSIILTNAKPNDNDYPLPSTFKLGNQDIPNITPPHKTTRILGVFWTLDSNSKKTIQLAIEEMETLLNLLRHKYVPGKIASHLIKTIIIPRLQYRLQLSQITTTELTQIDRAIKIFIKKKNQLRDQTPDDVLYNKHYGFNITPIDQLMDETGLNLLMKFALANNIKSNILFTMADLITSRMKLPESILSRPTILPLALTKKNYIAYITTQARLYNMKFIIEERLNPLQISHYLNDTEYDQFAIEINKHDIKQVEDIRKTNSNQTLSFSEWANSLKKVGLRRKMISEVTVPEWYTSVIEALTTPTNTELTTESNRVLRRNITNPNISPRIDWFHNIEYFDHDQIIAWTDGSYKPSSNQLGCGSVININQMNESTIEIIESKPPIGCDSSTRPELWAIQRTLYKCKHNSEIIINTDSQVSIDNIKNFLRYKIVPPNILLNTANYDIIHSIHQTILDRNIKITLNKVKAHTGLKYNDLADTTAKKAANDIDTLNDRIPTNYNIMTAYINNKNTPRSPKKIIREEANKNNINPSAIRLTNRINSNKNITIDIESSIKVTQNKSHKLNPLDATDFLESKFRIELLNQQLAVLKVVRDKFNKRLTSITCPRCNLEDEDENHLFLCIKTKERLKDLITQTKEIADQRIKLRQNRNIKIENIADIIKNFDSNDQLLNEEFIRGIITEEFKKNLSQIITTKEHIKSHAIFITECWLSAFYKIIWKPRNRITYNNGSNHKKKDSHKVKTKPSEATTAHRGKKKRI